MSEHMLWETIDEQKRKIADLEQDLKHKKIAIQNRNARIKELEETCKDLSDKFDFQVKRVMQLEAQIEKMKCPQNCKNGSVYNWSDNSICMDCEKVRTLHEDNWQEMCKGCKYWELRR